MKVLEMDLFVEGGRPLPVTVRNQRRQAQRGLRGPLQRTFTLEPGPNHLKISLQEVERHQGPPYGHGAHIHDLHLFIQAQGGPHGILRQHEAWPRPLNTRSRNNRSASCRAASTHTRAIEFIRRRWFIGDGIWDDIQGSDVLLHFTPTKANRPET